PARAAALSPRRRGLDRANPVRVSADAPSDPDLDAVMAFLCAGADRVIATHIAAVFLTGDRAYELKKAVDLGFLDCSTREERAGAIRRELGFNRRTAPDLYLEVGEVGRRP